MYDMIVVGGGPAGLTAALYAARAGKQVLVLERESFGGQIVYSPLVENFPALPHISGAELANRLYEQVEALGVELSAEEVLSVTEESPFTVTTDLTTHTAKAVILAAGVKHRALGLDGEEELVGCGVSYCAVCDGAFYADRDVAVVGGGDTALQDALFLANTCRSVTLIHRREQFRGEQHKLRQLEQRENVTILRSTQVAGFLTQDGMLSGLTLKSAADGAERTLAVEGVFLAVGQEPCSGAFASLAATDAAGYFTAGEDCCTDRPGVFAAGDCRSKAVRQLTTAVGDGAVAALAACNWLDAQE